MDKSKRPDTAKEVFAAEAEQKFSPAELCGEIVTTLKDLFVCEFSQSGNSFCMKFLNGQKFLITVAESV